VAQELLRCISGGCPASIRCVSAETPWGALAKGVVNRNRFACEPWRGRKVECRMKSAEAGGGWSQFRGAEKKMAGAMPLSDRTNVLCLGGGSHARLGHAC
jgi:hypothetical protein